MEGFTIIDGVVGATIILSALLAYARGFVREAMSIAGWVIATILAFIFADVARPLIKQVPYVGDFIGENCEISVIAAFAAVFGVALVVVSLITPIFSSLVQRSALGGLDQGLGFIFGVLRGVLLVAVAFFVYDTILAGQNIEMVENSRSASIFGGITGQVENQNPEAALSWITTQYEQLVGVCSQPAE
jgi:membrane protein required for colicin V production